MEFRWQEGRDLSPLASSFDSADMTRGWFARLSGLFRPPAPNSSQGVPSRSAAYQTFADDGTAALIWRLYEPSASALHDQATRTPLVARVFIGPADVMTPSVAIALCRSNLVDRLSPRPGDAAVEYGLAWIPSTELVAEAKAQMDDLDEQGRLEEGLATLIAAAVRDRDMPLSVVLPGQELTLPLRDCPQLALMWGLWRTTAQLLAGPDAARKPAGGWSFSTYEPPPGDTETRGLPAIVFRSQSIGRSHKAGRVESRVEPRARTSSVDDSDVVAGLLADAYRTLGGRELEQLLHAIASDHDGVDGRLDACRRRLRGLSSEPADAQQAGPGTTAQAQPPATARHGGFRPVEEPVPPGMASAMPESESDGALRPVPDLQTARMPSPMSESEPPAALAEHGSPTMRPQEVDAVAHAGSLPPGPAASASMPESASPSEGAHPSGHLAGSGHGHRKVHRSEQWTLTAVLDSFHHGPKHIGFAAASKVLRDGRLTPPEPERAKARNMMPGEDWYLPALIEADRWHVEDMLEALFALAVIPDLNLLEVRLQLGGWVAACPPEVIRALSAAADHKGGRTASSLEQVLRPMLYKRWLREHSIHFAHAAVEADPARSSKPRLLRWQIISNGPRSGVIASLLAWLCLMMLTYFLIVLLI
jgi:hypothetical protein